MKNKRICSAELAYVLGIVILAFGTALMERAGFGMSMVVAPAYLLHLKLSQTLPWFTFGVSEYVFQAFLLVVLSLFMRRFRKSYLFSFVTAVLYGITLDLAMAAAAFLPGGGMVARVTFYLLGMVLCSIGVAFFFRTYISPEAYELFVKEMADKLNLRIDRVKTAYDCISCLAGVALSFAFFGFGHFEGVKLGTILCALVNGWLIGRISDKMETLFEFRDAFPLRSMFEQ